MVLNELKLLDWDGVSRMSRKLRRARWRKSMKRIGNCYRRMTHYSRIYLSFLSAIRHKKSDREVRALTVDPTRWTPLDEKKIDRFLHDIQDDLLFGRYHPSPPRKKRVYCTSLSKGKKKGKWRTLYCPTLRDLVVQHLLIESAEEAFTRGMYRWCEGSVPGRGPTQAAKALEKWCRTDYSWQYFVEIDIRHFFEEIRREDVMRALECKIKDDRFLYFHNMNLHSCEVPVPIGYFSSPWYANLLLEPLDHHIKEDLYKVRREKRIPIVRHYIRYIDNMMLLGNSKRDLEHAVRDIQAYLKLHYGLSIKPTWEIKRIAIYDDGKIRSGTYRIKYLGYSIDRTRTILDAGGYLSTKRLAKKLQHKKTYRVSDWASLIAKTGFAIPVDDGQFKKQINQYFPIRRARELISYVST